MFENVDRQQTTMDKVIILIVLSSRDYIPSFKAITQLVLEMKIFKGFYKI